MSDVHSRRIELKYTEVCSRYTDFLKVKYVYCIKSHTFLCVRFFRPLSFYSGCSLYNEAISSEIKVPFDVRMISPSRSLLYPCQARSQEFFSKFHKLYKHAE